MVTLPSTFRILQENTLLCIAYKIQKFISHSSGCWKSETSRVEWGLSSLSQTSHCILTWWEFCGAPLWGINPILRVPALWFKHLLKVLCVNTIMFGDKDFNVWILRGQKHQNMAVIFLSLSQEKPLPQSSFPEMVTTIWSFLCAILLSGVIILSSRKCAYLSNTVNMSGPWDCFKR